MAIIRRGPGKPFYGLRDPRFIKGYPSRPGTMIRRLKRDNVRKGILRQPRPRIHARTASRLGTRLSKEMALEELAMDGIHGSLEERIVYAMLIKHDFIPGVDFTFQSSQLGGRGFLGGLVADFLFEYSKVIIQVQSYWHTVTSEHQQRDTDQSIILESMGYTVLELWPETLHSQANMENWIQRNITTLRGTTKQPLGLQYRSRQEGYDNAQLSQVPASNEFFTTLDNLRRLFG